MKPIRHIGMTLITIILTISVMGAPIDEKARNNKHVQHKNSKTMIKIYCEYCGLSFPSVNSLVNTRCARHPLGPCKGFHKPYEGSEKSRYTCKYCGQQFQSLHSLVTCKCQRHPDGPLKGDHAPML